MAIEVIQGDITKQQDIEAVVNAANAELAPGGGVAGAIHKAAGPELYQQAKQLAPIKPGQCVITPAFNLPNQYVIHCLGPRYGIDEPADELLRQCYKEAIKLADQYKLSTIAFPALSTGAFGYPFREAAVIAWRSTQEALGSSEKIELARFVLFSSGDLETFRAITDSAVN